MGESTSGENKKECECASSAGSNRRKSEYLAGLNLRRSTWRKIQGVSDEFTAGSALLHNKRPVSDAAAQR